MRTVEDSSPEAAGRSAQLEFERRHARRREQAKKRYGIFGALAADLTADPRTIEAGRQGAGGELAAARELVWQLRRSDVVVIHDRRIPGRGRANIDHIAIGPGGVTVIDTKSTRGQVELGTVGVINRRERLLVNGRDRTWQLDSLERQIGIVIDRLGRAGVDGVYVLGALCYPFMRRGWLQFNRALDGLITVDDCKHVAKVANRAGNLTIEEIGQLAGTVARLFPADV